MKLSKIYTDKPDIFKPILFKEGLNVVYGEIRLPENRNKDTHNLGKSTLGRIIDFTLLSKRHREFFLFKHEDIFGEFTFFSEIKLNGGGLLTVRRSVSQASKISFKKHIEQDQDFSGLPDKDWDHPNVSFARAKKLLDGLLDLRSIKKPWDYRNAAGYLIRSQDDYNDVFKLKKIAVSRDLDWKPYLAHILGFDAELVKNHYQREENIKKIKETEETVKEELFGGTIEDISKVEGILLIRQKDAEKKQALLDSFDFREQDKEKTKLLVDEIDEQIAQSNSKRYSLRHNRKKIMKSLEDEEIFFNPDEAEKLFEEAGVLFAGQIKKDFEQLIDFNKSVTKERRRYLLDEKSDIDKQLTKLDAELDSWGKKRSETLYFLSDTEIFNKYKTLSNELISNRANIKSLENQKGQLQRLQEHRTQIRSLAEELNKLQSEIEKDVETQNSEQSSLFSKIRLFFSEIIDEVIDRKALLSVFTNQKGHLQFRAEILDESGNSTSAATGHTYRKLLCVAFDLAILRARHDEKFPHFVFLDGVFESLDNRKKEKLLSVIRQYSSLGIQSIITLIDSDLPYQTPEEDPIIDESEIILQLHDQGTDGRLFKMETW